MLTKDQYCLESIIESIDRIFDYTSGFRSADDFNNDHLKFDATLMNFVVIGEMAGKLSEDFKNGISDIDWVKIKGFRNIIAHDYFGIDAEEVWQIIKNKLPVLKSEINRLLD